MKYLWIMIVPIALGSRKWTMPAEKRVKLIGKKIHAKYFAAGWVATSLYSHHRTVYTNSKIKQIESNCYISAVEFLFWTTFVEHCTAVVGREAYQSHYLTIVMLFSFLCVRTSKCHTQITTPRILQLYIDLKVSILNCRLLSSGNWKFQV